jgi:BR serine/threonine kinase
MQDIEKNNTIVERVGPYELKKTIGVGSTGQVKLGVHAKTGFTVAVKIISKNLFKKKQSYIFNIEREITIMKLINHPHVLSLFDVYESEEYLYIILEYVKGGELFRYLVEQGKLKESEALEFFRQIISALEFCHHHYICHRDLKPENLLLDSYKKVKIADFGMASIQLNEEFCRTSCGSPHYASPEVISGHPYDGRLADVWSCGVILYALLTGTLPFDEDNTSSLLKKIKIGIFHIPHHVSSAAQDLIKKILIVDPKRRYTIADIKQHPWFLKNGGLMQRTQPSLLNFSRSIVHHELVDQEVLQSIIHLGKFTKEDLIKKLCEEGSSIQFMY